MIDIVACLSIFNVTYCFHNVHIFDIGEKVCFFVLLTRNLIFNSNVYVISILILICFVSGTHFVTETYLCIWLGI